MGQIIAVCNQKGGCGKTTIAVNLAQAFARLGQRVLVVDMDPQGSAMDWAGDMDALDVLDMALNGHITPPDVRWMRTQYDLALIDCPPQYAMPTVEAIRIADLVLVPVQPSQLDVWATTAIVDLIKARQQVGKGRPRAAFVVSRAAPRTRLSAQLRDTLAQQDFPTLASGTTQRVAYAEAAQAGQDGFRRPAPTGQAGDRSHPRRNQGVDECQPVTP